MDIRVLRIIITFPILIILTIFSVLIVIIFNDKDYANIKDLWWPDEVKYF